MIFLRSPLSALRRKQAVEFRESLRPNGVIDSYDHIGHSNAVSRRQLEERAKLKSTLQKNRFNKALAEVNDVLFRSRPGYDNPAFSPSAHKRKWVARIPLLRRKGKSRVGAVMRSAEVVKINAKRRTRSALRSLGVKARPKEKEREGPIYG